MRHLAKYVGRIMEGLVGCLVIGFVIWVAIIYLRKPLQPWINLAFSGERGMAPTLALIGLWEVLGWLGWRVILSYRWLWEHDRR